MSRNNRRRLVRFILFNYQMKEEKKTELEKEYELVEVNWYKAPRYKWREIDSIISYTKMVMKQWFHYLYKDKE